MPACEMLTGQILRCLRRRPDLSSQQCWGAEPGNAEVEIRTQPLPWVFQLRAPHRPPQGPMRCVRRGTHENPDTRQLAQGFGRYVRSGHCISQQEMLKIGMLQIPAASRALRAGQGFLKTHSSTGKQQPWALSRRQVTKPFLCKARAALFFPNNVISGQWRSCLSSSLSITQNVEELGSTAAPPPRGSVVQRTPPRGLQRVWARQSNRRSSQTEDLLPRWPLYFSLHPKTHCCSPCNSAPVERG